jgi:hypothetical protein
MLGALPPRYPERREDVGVFLCILLAFGESGLIKKSAANIKDVGLRLVPLRILQKEIAEEALRGMSSGVLSRRGRVSAMASHRKHLGAVAARARR